MRLKCMPYTSVTFTYKMTWGYFLLRRRKLIIKSTDSYITNICMIFTLLKDLVVFCVSYELCIVMCWILRKTPITEWKRRVLLVNLICLKCLWAIWEWDCIYNFNNELEAKLLRNMNRIFFFCGLGLEIYYDCMFVNKECWNGSNIYDFLLSILLSISVIARKSGFLSISSSFQY